MARKKNIHAPETLQKGDALPPDVQAMVAQMREEKQVSATQEGVLIPECGL